MLEQLKAKSPFKQTQPKPTLTKKEGPAVDGVLASVDQALKETEMSDQEVFEALNPPEDRSLIDKLFERFCGCFSG